MTFKTITGSQDATTDDTLPFKNAEEAWFWFIQAQTARNEGAKIVAGAGIAPRPCEPVDIIKALEKLYRNRRVSMDQVMVLRNFGRQLLSPDPRRPKEKHAYFLWHDALDKLEEILILKRIVVKPHWLTLVSNNDAR